MIVVLQLEKKFKMKAQYDYRKCHQMETVQIDIWAFCVSYSVNIYNYMYIYCLCHVISNSDI